MPLHRTITVMSNKLAIFGIICLSTGRYSVCRMKAGGGGGVEAALETGLQKPAHVSQLSA